MQTISNKKNFLRKFSSILISILLEVRVFYFVLSMPIDIQQYRGEIDAFCNNLRVSNTLGLTILLTL